MIDMSKLKIFINEIVRSEDGVNVIWKLEYKDKKLIYYGHFKIPEIITETDDYYTTISFENHKNDFKRWVENIENQIYIGERYYFDKFIYFTNIENISYVEIYIEDILENEQNGIKIIWRVSYKNQSTIFDSFSYIPFSDKDVTYQYYIDKSFRDNISIFQEWINNIIVNDEQIIPTPNEFIIPLNFLDEI